MEADTKCSSLPVSKELQTYLFGTAPSAAQDAQRRKQAGPAATRPGHGQSGANDAGPQEAGVAGAMSAPHGSTPSQPRAPGRSPEKNNCKTFEYTCPFCNGAVRSSVRSGIVNHRKHCGKQFRVTDGCVRNKQMAYRCPFCDATVASSVMTGQVNHRSVCGNQFYVRNGRVSNTTRQHAHTCPQCQTVVWSARAAGRVHAQHKTPAGRPCPRTRWNSDRQ